MRHLTLLLVCLVLWLPALASAQDKLLYAGSLAQGGVPVDDTVRMTFRIFSEPTGAEALWTSAPVDVEVAGGRFEHTLGSTTAIDTDAVFDASPGPRWVEVTIGDTALTPRTRLATSPPSARDVSFVPVEGAATTVAAELEALRNEVDELRQQLDAMSTLSALADVVTIEQGERATNVIFEDVNLHLRNGMGRTQSSNGAGNLILGYNADCTANQEDSNRPCNAAHTVRMQYRRGSHNLIVGDFHNWESHSGMLVGMGNDMRAVGASAIGGRRNIAGGIGALTLSGEDNRAQDEHAVLLSGEDSDATGPYSVIIGGDDNKAEDEHTIVIGGDSNTAKNPYAIVLGGQVNEARDPHAIVVGGTRNEAREQYGIIVGGDSNDVGGNYAVVIGGDDNDAWDDRTVILGGKGNVLGVEAVAALETYAVQVGGENNRSRANFSVGVGGLGETITVDNQCRVAAQTFDQPPP